MILSSNRSDETLNPVLPVMGLAHRMDRWTLTTFASACVTLPQNSGAAE